MKKRLTAPEGHSKDALVEYLQDEVRDLLELQEPPGSTIPFSRLGMDSLTAVEFEERLQDALGQPPFLSVSLIFEHPTIQMLAEHIAQQFGDSQEAKSPPSAASSLPHDIKPVVTRFSENTFRVEPAGGSASGATFLSIVDQLLPFNVACCVVMDGLIDATLVCENLSRTLQFFPEMAGRLKGSPGGYFIDYSTHFILVETEQTSLTLPDDSPRHLLVYGEATTHHHLHDALPELRPTSEALNTDAPIFACKITHTSCNRTMIGIRYSHVLHDFASFQLFSGTWSKLNDDPAYQPTLFRDRSAMDRLGNEAPPIESQPTPRQTLHANVGDQTWSTMEVQFSTEQLSEIEAVAGDTKGAGGITRVQALQALLWKRLALIRWQDAEPSAPAPLTQIVDLRERITSIPNSYVGNACMAMTYSNMTIGELRRLSLAQIAAILQGATIRNMEKDARRQILTSLQNRSLGLLGQADAFLENQDSLRINWHGRTSSGQSFMGLPVMTEAIFIPEPKAWYCTIVLASSGCTATFCLPSEYCTAEMARQIAAPADGHTS